MNNFLTAIGIYILCSFVNGNWKPFMEIMVVEFRSSIPGVSYIPSSTGYYVQKEVRPSAGDSTIRAALGIKHPLPTMTTANVCGAANMWMVYIVGRPSNAPQAGPLETELRSDAKTRSRVYIASIHPELSESDIKTVFEAFGKVEGCTLYPDPKYPGRHRGFGYIEFESEESAISAVSSMNCFDLAGQQLRVARAITPMDVTLPLEANITTKINLAATSTTPSSAVALAAANISAKVMSMDAQEAVTSETSRHSTTTRFSMSTTDNPGLPPPGVFIPSAIGGLKPDPVTDQNALANSCETDEVSKSTASMWDDDEDSAVPIQPNNTTDITEEQPSDPDERIAVDSNTAQSGFLFTSPLSRVLLLENMLDAGDVDEEVEEEVREECARFGEVLRVIIHINGSDVRIFVQFDRSDVTQIACDALNQRFFSGRVVRARLYDEEQFQLHELDN